MELWNVFIYANFLMSKESTYRDLSWCYISSSCSEVYKNLWSLKVVTNEVVVVPSFFNAHQLVMSPEIPYLSTTSPLLANGFSISAQFVTKLSFPKNQIITF